MSPDQILAMRAAGFRWSEIAREAGEGYDTLRSRVDPEFAERRRLSRVRSRRERHSAKTREAAYRNPAYDPRRDGPRVYRTPFSELLGEPPIGRRELLESMMG